MTLVRKMAEAKYRDLLRAVQRAKSNNPDITDSSGLMIDIDVRVYVETTDFEDDEIVEAFEKLNKLDGSERWQVEQAYRRMAEGDTDAAMDILYREFDLTPPSHEKKLADLLTVDRG